MFTGSMTVISVTITMVYGKANPMSELYIFHDENDEELEIIDEDGNRIVLTYDELKRIYRNIIKIEKRDIW